MYYDREGKPMAQAEWVRRFSDDDEYKRVALDTVGAVRVSTVWLGLDHGFHDSAPIIFETMVFEGDRDGDCERYCTLDEAKAGHAAMVERVKAAQAAQPEG